MPQTDRYKALLQALQTIATVQDLSSLVQTLGSLLHEVVEFDRFDLFLCAPDNIHLTIVNSGELPKYVDRIRLDDAPLGEVWETQKPYVNSYESCRAQYPVMVANTLESFPEAKTMCIVPLTTVRQRLGVLNFVSSHDDVYHDADVEFIEHLAAQVAVAVENSLNYERALASEASLAKERDGLRVLMDVTNAAVTRRDLKGLMSQVSEMLDHLFGAESAGLYLYDRDHQQLRLETLHMPDGAVVVRSAGIEVLEAEHWRTLLADNKPLFLEGAALEELAERVQLFAGMISVGLRVATVLPMWVRGEFLGMIVAARRNEIVTDGYQLHLLEEIVKQVSIAVANTVAYREISQLKDQLASEKLYLEEEIRIDHNFDEIIGESAALRKVLAEVEKVAVTDSTVLITGETGTGKELVARAIHNLSQRRTRALVKLNCAAIPSGLLESELFGHEKGSFTGALAQKIGRLELAHQGTLFLDEIGELALDLQPKLLRALQEREFERVGGSRAIRVDLRLIAATNRDLEQMVNDRHFRSDLFYRLNVVPIHIPPLRERREDIPPLIRHFTQKYARKLNRKIDRIPADAMQALTKLNLPGNVRELENIIERAVILSTGEALEIPLASLHGGVNTSIALPAAPPPVTGHGALLDEDSEFAERENIFRALLSSNGIVSGPKGAAQKLGLSAAALFSKMLVLGISFDNTHLAQPSRHDDKPPADEAKAAERAQILRVLHETNWVIAGEKGAAARLGLKRTTLLARMTRLGITRH